MRFTCKSVKLENINILLGNLDPKYMHGMNLIVSVYELKIMEYTGKTTQNSR